MSVATVPRSRKQAAAVRIDSSQATLRLITETGRTVQVVHVTPHSRPKNWAPDRRDIQSFSKHLAALGYAAWGQVGSAGRTFTHLVFPTGDTSILDGPLPAMNTPVTFGWAGAVAERLVLAVLQDDGQYEVQMHDKRYRPKCIADISPRIPVVGTREGWTVPDVPAERIAEVARVQFQVDLVGPGREWLLFEESERGYNGRVTEGKMRRVAQFWAWSR